ncbi:hypothetical protein OF83DRAFT_1087247 [Amylostereum chailletii]|nr:hypothetical protein OF83DRAFT_1087247 [Amylostereum chailletii]
MASDSVHRERNATLWFCTRSLEWYDGAGVERSHSETGTSASPLACRRIWLVGGLLYSGGIVAVTAVVALVISGVVVVGTTNEEPLRRNVGAAPGDACLALSSERRERRGSSTSPMSEFQPGLREYDAEGVGDARCMLLRPSPRPRESITVRLCRPLFRMRYPYATAPKAIKATTQIIGTTMDTGSVELCRPDEVGVDDGDDAEAGLIAQNP